jgi:hypothetical protein
METTNYFKKIELFISKLVGRPIFLIDEPIITYKELKNYFSNERINQVPEEMWPKKKLKGLRIIELIYIKKGRDYDCVLMRIDEQGYKPVECQYFAKMIKINDFKLRKYLPIICLDHKIVSGDRVLAFSPPVDDGEESFLDGFPKSFIGKYDLWYSVVKK